MQQQVFDHSLASDRSMHAWPGHENKLAVVNSIGPSPLLSERTDADVHRIII